jgi:hemerythrin superfamily protein
VLRDISLIPLSRQHQHALALCVRIDRAQPIADRDLPVWQEEIKQQFRQEIDLHFSAEEEVLFPVARNFPDLVPILEDLTFEHSLLRREFSKAETNSMSAEDLLRFAKKLSEHIRKEERQLFERLQQLMKAEEMAALGAALDKLMQEISQNCILPNESTRIRAGQN